MKVSIVQSCHLQMLWISLKLLVYNNKTTNHIILSIVMTIITTRLKSIKIKVWWKWLIKVIQNLIQKLKK
jgi:hypothetical protein